MWTAPIRIDRSGGLMVVFGAAETFPIDKNTATSEYDLSEASTEMSFATPTTSEADDESTIHDDGESIEIRFLCSFRQMQRGSKRVASEFFATHNPGRWAVTRDFPLEPLTMVLHIIHGNTRDLPDTVSLETLADIASIVEYLVCHDAVDFFGRNWLSRCTEINHLPTAMNEELVQFIHVSFTFENKTIFEQSTETAFRHSPSDVPTYDLPIQEDVLTAIQNARSSLLAELIEGLSDIQENLLKEKLGCSYGCRSMLLGAWRQAMHEAGISPPPWMPDSSLTLDNVISTLRASQSPKYFSLENDGPHSEHTGRWTLASRPMASRPIPPTPAQPTTSRHVPARGTMYGGFLGPRPQHPREHGQKAHENPGGAFQFVSDDSPPDSPFDGRPNYRSPTQEYDNGSSAGSTPTKAVARRLFPASHTNGDGAGSFRSSPVQTNSGGLFGSVNQSKQQGSHCQTLVQHHCCF